MLAAEAVQSGPPWVQTLLAVLAVVGGGGGVAALATVLLQRKKFAADAADVLTDTALTLLEPLKLRVRELEGEVKTTKDNLVELSDTVSGLTSTLRRWRAAILSLPIPAPESEVLRLRAMVAAEPAGVGVNGRDPD